MRATTTSGECKATRQELDGNCDVLTAGLMLVNLVWFLWVVRSFEYKAVEHPSMRQAPAQKPQGTLPPWVQPQIVSGVQQANVRCAKLACMNARLRSHTSLHCVKGAWLVTGPFLQYLSLLDA